MKGSWAGKKLSFMCHMDLKSAELSLAWALGYLRCGGENSLTKREALRGWFCASLPLAGRVCHEYEQGRACWQTWSARTVQAGPWPWSPSFCWSRGRELHFAFSILQLLVIYRGKDLDPDCPEVSGYLKPITTLHSCCRFKNVSGIMSNRIRERLWASNKAAVTSLPSIFPGCQDTPPQGEGVYKFNLVFHSRGEWRDQSVITLGSDKLAACQ